MPIRSELERRAEHLGRSMKAGFSPVWVGVTAAVALVGGSALLGVLWSVRHLIWGLVIFLVILAGLIAEGSYRLAQRRDAKHAEQVAKLEQERDGARTELEEARRELRESLPAPAGRVDLGRIADDCDRLSRQINEYGAERMRGQPGHRFLTAKTQDGQHRQWVNRQGEQDRYRNETLAGFQQRFATDISRVWHAAKEAGIVGDDDFPEDRVYIEIAVTNERGMDRIADVLAELGRRAKTRQ